MSGLLALLELLPWWRRRRCERGQRTCWACATSERYFARARGGVTREEYLAEGADARRDVFQEELWERRDWIPGPALDQADIRREQFAGL